jgi:hypothetical protein
VVEVYLGGCDRILIRVFLGIPIGSTLKELSSVLVLAANFFKYMMAQGHAPAIAANVLR